VKPETIHEGGKKIMFISVYVYLKVGGGMGMGVKTITISIEAYEALLRLKRPGESFSDVILRLAKKRSLLDLAGVWKDVDGEELDRVLKEIREAWLKWDTRIE
jgi:predicted CopG family antitoxin